MYGRVIISNIWTIVDDKSIRFCCCKISDNKSKTRKESLFL